MENNSKNKHSKILIYRISLVMAAVCVCTAVVAVNSMRAKKSAEKYNVEVAPPKTTETKPVSSPKTDVPKQTEPVKKQSETISESASQTAKKTQLNETDEKKPSFSIEKTELLRPADGQIVFAHSGDKLVYNKLYDDWRVHSGVDIAANPSSQVKAAYDGTVEDVKTDGFGKFVITIDHKYFKTVYSGVSTDKLAEKGKLVKKGDVISGVPDKNTLYDLPHISFELIYMGNSIDPEPLFK